MRYLAGHEQPAITLLKGRGRHRINGRCLYGFSRFRLKTGMMPGAVKQIMSCRLAEGLHPAARAVLEVRLGPWQQSSEKM